MKNLIYIFIVAFAVVSCNAPMNHDSEKKAEANKAKVQRFYDEVMNAHNTAMIDSFCYTDFVDHNPDQGHTGQGTEELKNTMKEFFTAYPDLKVTTNFMIAQGDTVMAHVTMTGTNSGPMMGMPATNKQISIEGIDVIAIKDGKATNRWGFFDSMKMMNQLGLMNPPPGQGQPMPEGEKK